MTSSEPKLIFVCGPTGAGKTTHAISLSREIGAVRFSIDPWMATLFADDMASLDYDWMLERVVRCQIQIWETSEQILSLGGKVILDLGFTTRAERVAMADRAHELGILPELHYVTASLATRKARVRKRNQEKHPDVYAFEVTSMMINFMEPRFEPPAGTELNNGRVVDTDDP